MSVWCIVEDVGCMARFWVWGSQMARRSRIERIRAANGDYAKGQCKTVQRRDEVSEENEALILGLRVPAHCAPIQGWINMLIDLLVDG